jgi:hypothetical protein
MCDGSSTPSEELMAGSVFWSADDTCKVLSDQGRKGFLSQIFMTRQICCRPCWRR